MSDQQTENSFSLENIIKLKEQTGQANNTPSSENTTQFNKVVAIDFDAMDAAGFNSTSEVQNLSFFVNLNFSESEEVLNTEDLVLNFDQVIAKGLNPVETADENTPALRHVSIDLPLGYNEGENNLSLQEILGDELCRIQVEQNCPCAPDQITVDLGGTVTERRQDLDIV